MARREQTSKVDSAKSIRASTVDAVLKNTIDQWSSKNKQQETLLPESNVNFPEVLEKPEKENNESSKLPETTSDRYYNIITPLRFKLLQKKADNAIKTGKTFLMRARWPIVRRTFLNRGWIELYEAHYNARPSEVSELTYYDAVRHLPVRHDDESIPHYTSRCEKYILSRLIAHLPVSFTWSWIPNKTDFDAQLRHPSMIINKLLVSPFVSKEVLARNLKENLPWLPEGQTILVNFPRTYNSADPDQLMEFVQDFRRTACISFLKFMVEKSISSAKDVLFSEHPAASIPYSAVEFALQRCYEVLNSFTHNDIDSSYRPLTTDRDWDRFFDHWRMLVEKKTQIQRNKIQSVESVLRNAEMLLESIKPHWPEYNLEGHRNFWILKPADNMLGKGIEISNNLRKIKESITIKLRGQKIYIIQKYIERPFTIYNTKFDIRQYFLLTNVYPLIIWLYSESYLRFSTKPCSLDDRQESVHQTNSAIHRQHKADLRRDSRLPRQNMWDCLTFQAYLRQIGKGNVWEKQIYPAIKQTIIGTVLASQHNMAQRDNSFQLYGADIILCKDMKPWIIEINGCPNLYLTTNVTSRIVPQCVEDLFKVVVDRKKDPLADIGKFELIYNQLVSPNPKPTSRILSVTGKQMPNPTSQIRREMYQQLIQNSEKSDPRALLPLSTMAKPIRRGDSEMVDLSITSHFKNVSRQGNGETIAEKLEKFKRNLRLVAREP